MQSPGKIITGGFVFVFFCDTQSKCCNRIPKEPNENIDSLHIWSLPDWSWGQIQMANRKKQLRLVYRKPCDLHVHHRYKTAFYKPLTLRDFTFDTSKKTVNVPVCLLAFQMTVWLSHFPLSTENLVPQGWNGFYVILDLPREEVPPSSCYSNAKPMEHTNYMWGVPMCACAPLIFLEGCLGFPFTWKRKS